MRFGINLMLWTDEPTNEAVLPLLERLAHMGYDGVEIPVFGGDPGSYAAMGRRLDDLGLARTASTACAPDVNPISADPVIRRAGIEYLKRVLDACQAGGMSLLVGPCYAAIGTFTGRGPTADEWHWGVESMREVAVHAQACGITLALEFLNRFEVYLLNTAADTVRFVQEVGHPACGILYDTFHAHIEEKNIQRALTACSEHLVHVHLSENDRGTPGQGQISWDETFDTLAAIQYHGWLTIEAFGQALPRIAAATKIWRSLYQSEAQLAEEGLAFVRQAWMKR